MESPFASNNPFIVAEIGKNFIQSEEDKSVDEYISNAIKLVEYDVERLRISDENCFKITADVGLSFLNNVFPIAYTIG